MEDNIFTKLTDLQKDALKEIGNIGAGNAASSLAQLLDCQIKMSVPAVEIIPIEMVPEVTGDVEQKVSAILLSVTGEAAGNILFLLPEASSKHLLEILLKEPVTGEELAEMEISALQEIGNILSGSYLSVINKMTDFNLLQSVPSFAHDMAGAILSSILIQMSENSEYTLLIETQFINGSNKIEGYFFYIPDPGSLEKILISLGFDIK